ncbi:hypothetical protein Tco_0434337, partial [Tanacetum coccineum]
SLVSAQEVKGSNLTRRVHLGVARERSEMVPGLTYDNDHAATIKKPIGSKEPVKTGGLGARKLSATVCFTEYVSWDWSPIMAGDIIHFNTVNLLELSKLETSENHRAAKELNAEVIEENISTVIGTLNNADLLLSLLITLTIVKLKGSPNIMWNSVHFNNENPSEVSAVVLSQSDVARAGH